MNLKIKTFRAFSWNASDVFLTQTISFVFTILLSRLLDPQDFGVIAILQIFTALASLLIDSGLSYSLIQSKKTDIIDESTVFFFNILASTFLAFLLILLSKGISTFYKEPKLVYLTYAMSLNCIINSFGSIHQTLLIKELDFKKIMIANTVSTSLSGILALVLAYENYGVWSIACQILSTSLLTVFMLWSLHRWRPKLIFSKDSFLRLLHLGKFVMLSSSLDTIYGRLYSVLIGKFFNSTSVGHYWRAVNSKQLVSGVLESIISKVLFPLMSSFSDEKEKLYQTAKASLKIMMLINIPAMLGIIIVARPMVFLIFGPKWEPSVPILQVLCIGGVLWPFHVVNLDILLAKGHSKKFFKLEIVKKIIGTSLTLYSALYSVIAIAWVQVIMSVVSFYINTYYSKKIFDYSKLEQLRDTKKEFVAGAVMFICLNVANSYFEDLSLYLQLCLPVFLGIAIYMMMIIFMKVESFEYLKRIVLNYREKI